MDNFDKDEMICAIWEKHSDSDGLMDIMAARQFAIDLLAAASAQPSPAEPLDREAIRNEALEKAAFAVELEGCGYGGDRRYCKHYKTAALVIRDMKSQPAQPSDSQAEVSDTEMLDWLCNSGYSMDRFEDGEWCVYDDFCHQVVNASKAVTPREAIKAAMRAQEGS